VRARVVFAVTVAVTGAWAVHTHHRPAVAAAPSAVAHCVSTSGRPDPACTPGALNPAVNQLTIASTICVRGWSATVRPPVVYTQALKLRQMVAYGLKGRPGAYEEDHLIPLELGGAPSDPRNLWPQRWDGPSGAHAKDVVENRLRVEVCAGRLSLAAAQVRIAGDWETA
jgi:hypothetical protein